MAVELLENTQLYLHTATLAKYARALFATTTNQTISPLFFQIDDSRAQHTAQRTAPHRERQSTWSRSASLLSFSSRENTTTTTAYRPSKVCTLSCINIRSANRVTKLNWSTPFQLSYIFQTSPHLLFWSFDPYIPYPLDKGFHTHRKR